MLTWPAVARRPTGLTLLRLGFVVAFVYAFPYFGALHNANEVPRVFLTEEIVDRGTFRLDARWGELQLGSTFDVAQTPDGHKFSNKAPGTSLLGVPAYLALKAVHGIFGGAPTLAEVTWACRFVTSTLPVLLFLPLFRRTARRFARDEAADAALVALAFGSMVYPYAQVLFSHALAMACAGGGFAIAVALANGESQRPTLAALAVGFLLGWAVLADYQSALALGVVFIYLAARRPRALPAAILGGVPAGALLAWYHTACFGAPWKTGYTYAVDPAHKSGFLGVIGPNREAMAQALVTPDNGLIVLMPWVLVALAGIVILWRRRDTRAEAIAMAALAFGYVLFIGSTVPEFGRGGWSVGPRYIVVAMPFFAWLAAAGFDAVDGRPVLRAAAHALVLAGVIVMVAAATTFPYWPTSFKNPLYEVAFWALTTGHAPHSLGTLVGLRGIASLLPLYAVILAVLIALLARGQRARLATTICALVGAAIIVAALGWAPRTRDAAPKVGYLERIWEP